MARHYASLAFTEPVKAVQERYIYANAEIVDLADRPDLLEQLDPTNYKHRPERMLSVHVEAYDRDGGPVELPATHYPALHHRRDKRVPRPSTRIHYPTGSRSSAVAGKLLTGRETVMGIRNYVTDAAPVCQTFGFVNKPNRNHDFDNRSHRPVRSGRH